MVHDSTSAILPLFLKAKACPVLIVGGTRAAAHWTYRLMELGMKVIVVAPRLDEEFRVLAKTGRVRWRRSVFLAKDLKGVRLVLALSDDQALNRRVQRLAQGRSLWVYRADGSGDFILPAWLNRGDLWFALWTGGVAPWLQQILFRRLLRAFSPEWDALLVRIKRFKLFADSDDWPPPRWLRRWGRRYAAWLKHLKAKRFQALDKELKLARRQLRSKAQ